MSSKNNYQYQGNSIFGADMPSRHITAKNGIAQIPSESNCFLKTKFFPFQNFKNYWKRLKTHKVIANWNFDQMKLDPIDFPVTKKWSKILTKSSKL